MKELVVVLLFMVMVPVFFTVGFIEGSKETRKSVRTEAVNVGVGRWIDDDNDGVADGFEWVLKGEGQE